MSLNQLGTAESITGTEKRYAFAPLARVNSREMTVVVSHEHF